MRKKKDINEIIDKGPPRERINLFYTHISERDTGVLPGPLADDELRRLRDSFRTSREIDLFNKYITVNANVKKTIIHLNQLQLAYGEQIAYIRGIEDLWYALIETTALLNKLLQRVKDEDIAEEMLNDIVYSGGRYPFEYATDKDGRIILKTTSPGQEGETALEALTRLRRAGAERLLRHAKPILKAVYDYMKEKGFKIKVYQRQLKAIEKDLEEDKSISGLFSERKLAKELTSTKSPKKAELIKKVMTNHPERFIYPNYNELELDEEIYRDYRETYFNE